MDEKEKSAKDRIEIDFGKGKVSFEGIFRGIGGLLDMARTLEEKGTIEKKGEVESPEGIKGVYGFTVKTLAGRPIIETFGSRRTSPRGSTAEDVREPIVDIFDEGNLLVVISEMPGVEGENVSIEVEGDILRIAASSQSRQYSRELLLPCKVKPEPSGRSFRNGILEIRLEKEKQE